MNISPDTKDWTWVLGERCPDCGFDSREPARADLSGLAAELGHRWVVAMASVADVTARPDPGTWSPLEYACHVRDVFALARYRTALMLEQDDPLFANWDQDAAAVEEQYASQYLDAVMPALAARASGFADDLAALDEDQWARPGRRSDDKPFTVESFARYVLHDPIHHLTDVTGEAWA
ncbi:MAG: DinB family protein [Actinomycetota bacterium]|nr:DinB family protein [Actinomycetota bacterium]